MHYSIKYKILTATLAASILVGGISTNFAPHQTYAAEVTAANQVASITWGVNLREGAGSSFSKIRMLSKGEQVTIVGFAANGWLQVKDQKGNVGYISNDKKYTEVAAQSNVATPTTPSTSTNSGSSNSTGAVESQSGITTANVNFRKGPSSSYSRIRLLSKGETITIISKSGNWYYAQDKNGSKGYVSASYVNVGASSNNNTSVTAPPAQTTNPSSNHSSDYEAKIEKVIAAGFKYLGTPYEYGSSRSNTRTFDCSDFIRQIFIDALGVTLPGDSRKQGAHVKELGDVKTSVSQLERGDLMFFMSYKGSSKSSYSGVNKNTERITHVGIYLGDGEVLHTYSNESGGVKTNKITNTTWEYRFLFGGSAIK